MAVKTLSTGVSGPYNARFQSKNEVMAPLTFIRPTVLQYGPIVNPFKSNKSLCESCISQCRTIPVLQMHASQSKFMSVFGTIIAMRKTSQRGIEFVIYRTPQLLKCSSSLKVVNQHFAMLQQGRFRIKDNGCCMQGGQSECIYFSLKITPNQLPLITQIRHFAFDRRLAS